MRRQYTTMCYRAHTVSGIKKDDLQSRITSPPASSPQNCRMRRGSPITPLPISEYFPLPFFIGSDFELRCVGVLKQPTLPQQKNGSHSIFVLTVTCNVLYSMDPLKFTPLWGGVPN